MTVGLMLKSMLAIPDDAREPYVRPWVAKITIVKSRGESVVAVCWPR
jgi:hypothetical protein